MFFFSRGVQYLNRSKQTESTVWNRFSFPISEISLDLVRGMSLLTTIVKLPWNHFSASLIL